MKHLTSFQGFRREKEDPAHTPLEAGLFALDKDERKMLRRLYRHQQRRIQKTRQSGLHLKARLLANVESREKMS
jgi:hypothetical protein